MRKKLLMGVLLIGLLILFTGCHCKHEWQEATCTKAKTCKLCGEEEGAALGHDWQEATCGRPKICKRCSMNGGGRKEHDWQEATCESPAICKVCSATEGTPLGHTTEEWTITQAASCTETGKESGVCDRCGKAMEREIPITHVEGEWTTQEVDVETGKGIRVKNCALCGTQLKKEAYTLSEQETEVLYKEQCRSISYEELERRPNDYIGEYVKFTGEVVQVQETAGYAIYRIDVTKTRYDWWEDTVYVTFAKNDPNNRILEDDIVTFYGKSMGLHSYTSIMGAEITIPMVTAKYIDIN